MTNNILYITFKDNIITSNVFEQSVLLEIQKNLTETHNEVFFDFTNIAWIDLFELLRFPVVVDYLKSKGKKSKFIFYLPEHGETSEEDKKIRQCFFAMQEWGFTKYIKYDIKDEKGEVKTEDKTEQIIRFDEPKENPKRKIMPIISIGSPEEFKSAHQRIRGELEFFLKKTIGSMTRDVNDFIGTIIYEICENIHLHSLANVGMVSLRYHPALEFIPKHYHNQDMMGDFLKQHLDTPFFELVIVDSGIGIPQSLKEKKEEYKDWENIKLLEKAFEKRIFNNDVTLSNRGLYDVKKAIEQWDGYLVVRAGENELRIFSKNNKLHIEPKTKNSFLPGTHYYILFPAKGVREETYRKDLPSQIDLFEIETLKPLTTKFKIKYMDMARILDETREFKEKNFLIPERKIEDIPQDKIIITYPFNNKEIAKRMEDEAKEYFEGEVELIQATRPRARNILSPSYKEEEYLIDSIKGKIDNLEKDEILIIDCGGLSEIKTGRFERILNKLLLKFDRKICDQLLFINLKEQMIQNFFHADECLNLLEEKKSFFIGLNEWDIPLPLIKEGKIQKTIEILLRQKVIKKYVLQDAFKITTGEEKSLLEEYIENCQFTGKTKRKYTIYFCTDFREVLENTRKEEFCSLLKETSALHPESDYYHYQLPSGKHSDKYIESRLLFQDYSFMNSVAKEGKIRFAGKNIDVLYSYSLPGQTVCAYLMEKIEGIDRYVIGKNYLEPEPVFGTDICKGERVLIVTDVIGTGGLIEKMIEHVKSKEGEVVGIFAVIDTRIKDKGKDIAGKKVEALFFEEIEKYNSEECSVCKEKKKELIEINQLTLAPEIVYEKFEEVYKLQEEQHIKNLEYGEQRSLKQEREFWEMADNCNAVDLGHFVRDEHHYCYYINTHKILGNEENRKGLKQYIAAEICEHLPHNIEVILHPENYGSSAISQIFSNLLPQKPDLVTAIRKVGSEYDFSYARAYEISIASKHFLEGKNILVVDDGTNTGNTLLTLYGLIARYGGRCVGMYVMINRLDHALYEAFRETYSCFYPHYTLNLPVYDAGTCPLCQELDELQKRFSKAQTSMLKEFLRGKIKELTPIFLPGGH